MIGDQLEPNNGRPERTNVMRSLSAPQPGKTTISQLVRAIGAAAAVTLTLLALVPGASAKTATIHLFSRATSATFVTPQGRPLPPNTRPTIGDVNDITGVDYVGDHTHHASTPRGSDHLRCTLTALTAGGAQAVCDGQIALGGSMLLVNNESLTLPDSDGPLVFRINGGTGTYRHARGTITALTIGNNTDFVIRVNY
jgi:hypothetical protein